MVIVQHSKKRTCSQVVVKCLFYYIFSKRAFTILATVLTCLQVCIAQPEKQVDKESFKKLTDSIIIREIASFNITGSAIVKAESFPKTKLNEILLINCTDSSATFEKGNVKASEIRVSIYSEFGIPRPRIKEVRFIHYKYLLILPDSAIAGLFEPYLCSTIGSIKRKKISNCKVFQSKDKSRVYIYMLNGSGESQYEVTWVIKNSKYHTRVIDYCR